MYKCTIQTKYLGNDVIIVDTLEEAYRIVEDNVEYCCVTISKISKNKGIKT